MNDSKSPIKAGTNEILLQIKRKNQKLHLLDAFAEDLEEYHPHVTRHDLLALDNDTLGRVVESICDKLEYDSNAGNALKGAKKEFGSGWVDVDAMRKALTKHQDRHSYAYMIP